MKRTLRLWRWAAAAIGSGSVFVLSGCEPTIRETILSGMEDVTYGIAETIIAAFFLGLQQSNSTTTTMLRAAEEAIRLLA